MTTKTGTPVTIQCGSSFHAGRIVKASASGKTLTVAFNRSGEQMAFRLNRFGQYRGPDICRLSDIGAARDEMDWDR